MCGQTTCKHGKNKWANMIMGGSIMLAFLMGIAIIQQSPDSPKEVANGFSASSEKHEEAIIRHGMSSHEKTLQFEPMDRSRAVRITCEDDDSILVIIPEKLTARLSNDGKAVAFKDVSGKQKLLILTHDDSGWQMGAIGERDGAWIHVSNVFDLDQERVQGELVAWATEP